ncbi:MAG: type I-F CRISPR-associated endoribonuclease Cas6/Csy4, partial [Zetaproteobacteria bacterium]|nr:type I-F CRISPR-associated endoribonuclease Cas6/Csy4 [Zetaproteobacteria bacterium]
MNCYLDIKIVPDDDIPIYFIRNKVYTKLHKALSTMKATDIGVSFPKYRVKLGDVLRIHGTKQRLEA